MHVQGEYLLFTLSEIVLYLVVLWRPMCSNICQSGTGHPTHTTTTTAARDYTPAQMTRLYPDLTHIQDEERWGKMHIGT